MDFKNIFYAYLFACRAVIVCEKNELSLHRVKLPHLPCVFLIRAAILFCVRHEVNHCYEHYLFFRLQEMHHNDVLRMETQEIELPEDDEKISNAQGRA